MGAGASAERQVPALQGTSAHVKLVKQLTTNVCSYNTTRHDRLQSLLSLARLSQTHSSLCSTVAMDLGAVGVRATLKDLTHHDFPVRSAAAKLLIALAQDRYGQKLLLKV